MGQNVALVTGGSRGIGAAISQTLADSGVAVVVAARGLDACRRRADEINGRGGVARALELDVADPESVASAMGELRRLENAIGPVNWLVNNAGMAVSAPLLRGRTDAGADLFEQHLSVNFHGPRRLVEALLPGMLERRSGRILAIASSAGLMGYAYVSAYCASKHALLGYTRAAALEFDRSGVAFGAICPHYVDSPMLSASVANIVARTGKSEDEARAFFAKQNPGGRLVQPEDVASTALGWLETGANGAITELDGSQQPAQERP